MFAMLNSSDESDVKKKVYYGVGESGSIGLTGENCRTIQESVGCLPWCSFHPQHVAFKTVSAIFMEFLSHYIHLEVADRGVVKRSILG